MVLACGPLSQEASRTHDIADAQNTAWVARHGLNAAQYQNEFNNLVAQGYRPTYISGYAVNNEARFAAIFDRIPNTAPWVARHNLTAAQYQTEFDRLASQGYRPVLVNGYTVGSQDFYVAIWEQRSGPAWIARHGMTSANYQDEFNKQLQAGYRLTHVSGYSVNGSERYAAIWEKSSGSPWAARHGMDAATYQAEFNRLNASGYRLVLVSAFTVNGQDRFAAIWEQRGGLPFIARHGLDSASYQTAFDDLRYQGYRPAVVSGYGSGANPQFAAIWHNTQYSAADLNHIDSVVEALRKSKGVPAISIAIAKDGRLVFAKAYGDADKENGIPASSSHRFRIASISKPITATAILKLVDAGRLSLDQKVFGPQGVLGDDYGFKRPYNPGIVDITIRQLLQHTAGGWTNDGSDPMFTHPEMSSSELISWVLDNRPLDHVPGTFYAYSNFGYCILGRIIEKASGVSYQTFVKQNVLAFSPSAVVGGDTLSARLPNEVKYYDQGFSPYGMKIARMDSHGGWVISPIDLVRFGVSVDRFNTKPDQLSTASLNAMITGSSANPSYGLGWSINSVGNYWHNGSLPGTSSILVRTSGGFVWSAITNSRENSPDIDGMMWSVVNGVSTWPLVDLF